MYSTLPLGGFGLSRFVMDDGLQQLAVQYGATVIAGARVTDVGCGEGVCIAQTATGHTYRGFISIGSWGKRDVLDKKLDRDFINTHTG